VHTTEQLNAALEGRYIIQRIIGEGGMATVFLARDVKHNRSVALKVLKPDLGVIVGVERFLAEIEVTANLQHPNLLPLFDSGATDGVLFYVMPYVEGESLRARLDREKQLPVDEVVRIVSSIASALDYAHRHDVIHRDLKPENILLHDGQPLVADFGIALAVSKAGGNRITQTGLSLGTPQYMSPEQATGDRGVDARTDIYSLGAVTYEMLTGEAPHVGSTSQAVIARVLTERPRPIRSSRPSVPEHIEFAVDHALEKLPADRFATAKEFAEALSSARAVAAMPARTAAPPTMEFVRARSRVQTAVPWALAAIATAAAAWAWRPRPVEPIVPARFSIGLPDSVQLRSIGGGSKVALSRDGTQLAMIAGRIGEPSAVYLRRLSDPLAERVRGTDSAVTASFSPEGDWLLFTTPNKIKKVPVTGGQPYVIVDTTGAPHWGEDNRVVYTLGQAGLFLTTGNGGQPRLVAARDSARRIASLGHPEILPGGTHVLVTVRKGLNIIDSSYLATVSLEDGEIIELDMLGTNAHYVKSGHVLFGRPGGDVYVAPFSLRTRTFTGPAGLLLQDVSQRPGGPTDYGVSQNGILVYHTGLSANLPLRYMTMVDRNGAERPLQSEPAYYTDPRVSPDGKMVAFDFRAGGQVQQLSGDVFVDVIATGVRTRISSTGTSVRAEWSADGRQLYWIDQPSAESSYVRVRQWDRPGEGAVLARGTANGAKALNTMSVGPAGGWAAFRIGDNSANTEVWVAPMDSLAALRPYVETPYRESSSAVSPNGKYLAYASDETGTNEIYIVHLPTPGVRVSVSVGGGIEPAWSRDGKELYFRGPRRMMVATITERPTLAVSRIDSLFVDRYFSERWHRQYDVHPSGQLMMVGVRGDVSASATNLYAIVNWEALLGARREGR
jgi:serine/threonine-protein kinase